MVDKENPRVLTGTGSILFLREGNGVFQVVPLVKHEVQDFGNRFIFSLNVSIYSRASNWKLSSWEGTVPGQVIIRIPAESLEFLHSASDQ